MNVKRREERGRTLSTLLKKNVKEKWKRQSQKLCLLKGGLV